MIYFFYRFKNTEFGIRVLRKGIMDSNELLRVSKQIYIVKIKAYQRINNKRFQKIKKKIAPLFNYHGEVIRAIKKTLIIKPYYKFYRMIVLLGSKLFRKQYIYRNLYVDTYLFIIKFNELPRRDVTFYKVPRPPQSYLKKIINASLKELKKKKYLPKKFFLKCKVYWKKHKKYLTLLKKSINNDFLLKQLIYMSEKLLEWYRLKLDERMTTASFDAHKFLRYLYRYKLFWVEKRDPTNKRDPLKGHFKGYWFIYYKKIDLI